MAKRKDKKIIQSRDELLRHLAEHIQFMHLSAQAYDNGYTGEAKRLAVSLRVILHQTTSSHSLLELLKVKTGFYDTSYDYDAKNLLSHHGLVMIRMGGGNAEFIPRFDEPLGGQKVIKKLFHEWWNKVVIADSKKEQFSRRQLVLALSNQDGGAHVDPGLDEAYANLSRNNTIGWIFSDGVTETPLMAVELASVRQIAHEVLMTLKDLYPQLF